MCENAESASLMRSGVSSLRTGWRKDGPASQPIPAATNGGVNTRIKRIRARRRIPQKIRDAAAVSSIAKMRLAQKHTNVRELQTGKTQDRNSTDSRWNVLNAKNSAAPAYTQVEAKMSAIEFQ